MSIRSNVRKYFEVYVTGSDQIKHACVEDVMFLVDTVGFFFKLSSVDENEKTIWWDETVKVTENLKNEHLLRFFIFRLFKKGLELLCGLNPKVIFAKNKTQKVLGRANAFVVAIIEAYDAYHMKVTNRNIAKGLLQLNQMTQYSHRSMLKPSKDIMKDVRLNCKYLAALMEQYSWSKISLLPECTKSEKENL